MLYGNEIFKYDKCILTIYIAYVCIHVVRFIHFHFVFLALACYWKYAYIYVVRFSSNATGVLTRFKCNFKFMEFFITRRIMKRWIKSIENKSATNLSTWFIIVPNVTNFLLCILLLKMDYLKIIIITCGISNHIDGFKFFNTRNKVF